MTADNGYVKCRWCNNWWTGKRHDCAAKESCDWEMPCTACGKKEKWVPCGYGKAVDAPTGWLKAYATYPGYSRLEDVCSPECKAKIEARECWHGVTMSAHATKDSEGI